MRAKWERVVVLCEAEIKVSVHLTRRCATESPGRSRCLRLPVVEQSQRNNRQSLRPVPRLPQHANTIINYDFSNTVFQQPAYFGGHAQGHPHVPGQNLPPPPSTTS